MRCPGGQAAAICDSRATRRTRCAADCLTAHDAFLSRNVVTVRQFDELTAAAQLMREKHIGYLVVVEPDVAEGGARPIGVLTDRDIVVAVVAGGADARALRVGDVMTQQPVTVAEFDT